MRWKTVANLSLSSFESVLALDSYFGGRVENFTRGSSWLSYQDFDGLYGHGMCQFIPTGPPSFSPSRIYNFGYLSGTVHTPLTVKLPLLPYPSFSRIIFPVGQYSSVWSSYELSYSMDHYGRLLLNIHENISFRGFPVYCDMLTNFINNKLSRETALLGNLLKGSITFLYGRFALDPVTHVYYPSSDSVLAPLHLSFGALYTDLSYYTSHNAERHPFTNIFVASYSTIGARNYIHHHAAGVILSDLRLVYIDTDSLAVEGGGVDGKNYYGLD